MTTKQLINDVRDIVTEVIEKETADISYDITNLKDNVEDWIDDSRTGIIDAIDTIAQEQDKLKDDIKDIREKLGEILTILHSLPQ
jgi:hypothetical protein